jgi:Rhodopirellula transposase DDE domain
MGGAAAAIAERYRLMCSQLNERQRRRFAASEARTFGYGGIAAAARACGLAENTVRKGLLELDEPESLGPGRVRREGAGRPAGEDSDPGLLDALRALVGDDVRGDPERVLLWTSKSVRHLAEELGAQGHQAGKDLVARLLKRTLGFSLQAACKTLEGKQHPWPVGCHSPPAFLNSPTSSFFLVSILIAGCPAAIVVLTVWLICRNWASRSVPLPVIQRQLWHSYVSTTSVYLQGIDVEEIIGTIHARRVPMMHVSAGLELSHRPERQA